MAINGRKLHGSKVARMVPMPPAPAHRPTIYDPGHCHLVEEMGKQGKSRAQMASMLNVSRQTLYEWGASHSEFGDALSRAREHEQAWWEEHARSNLKTKVYQAQLWRYSMAGRFRDEYGDRPNQVNVAISLRDAIGEAEKPKQVDAQLIPSTLAVEHKPK